MFWPRRPNGSSQFTRLKGGIRPIQKLIGWESPPTGSVMINKDGAADKDGNTTADGLIRDHPGNFLMGFQRNIGACSSLAALL